MLGEVRFHIRSYISDQLIDRRCIGFFIPFNVSVILCIYWFIWHLCRDPIRRVFRHRHCPNYHLWTENFTSCTWCDHLEHQVSMFMDIFSLSYEEHTLFKYLLTSGGRKFIVH